MGTEKLGWESQGSSWSLSFSPTWAIYSQGSRSFKKDFNPAWPTATTTQANSLGGVLAISVLQGPTSLSRPRPLSLWTLLQSLGSSWSSPPDLGPWSFLTTAPPWCIPVRRHASTVRRFIQPRVHGAERCSPIAALQRSLCSDSSPCRLSWCSPPPPAPSWSGDYALSCLPRRGRPNRAAHRDAAKRSWRAAALTKRNNFVPGSDASETSPCREPPLDFQKVNGRVERPPLDSERSARSRQEMATGSLGPGWRFSLRGGRWSLEKVLWALLPHQANAFHSYLWSAASFADICVSQNQASPRISSAISSNQTS